MITRTLKNHLLQLAKGFPIISVTGPRQSGKTTLVRDTFPKHSYISLEDIDTREFAQEDPRGFLNRFQNGVILDEIQKVPQLFSYLQTRVDQDLIPGNWILTGSQNYLLMEKVSQSLAGRTAITQLYPFSIEELQGEADELNLEWNECLFTGFFPKLHVSPILPKDWYSAYIRTYLERDVRDLLRLGDLSTFSRFLRLAAARTGQLLNYNSLAVDCGVSQPTAKSWLSILEATGLVFLLSPHYANFSKRLIKTPKLYWTDTGILCHLLRVNGPEDLLDHPYRGAIFESYAVSEILKWFIHNGKEANLFFWRDRTGHEVDVILEAGKNWIPLEIKSSETVSGDYFHGLEYWLHLDSGKHSQQAGLIYCGKRGYTRSGFEVIPWDNTASIMKRLFGEAHP